MIRGLKTKIGCGVILLGAVVLLVYPAGLSVALAGVALAIYGLYDRGMRNNRAQAEKVDELKSRIKKPMLRGV